MTIRDWPEQERPREKLIARGAVALSDAELLAIFIGTGQRGRTAVDVGRDILAQRGSLRALLDLDVRELATHAGLGIAKASRLSAALELGRRYLESQMVRADALRDPLACLTYVRSRLNAYPYEVFACVFLDSHHRVIAFEELFRGSLKGAEVHSREVVRRCLAHNAGSVIFAHNHPSGDVEASPADRDITLQLKNALESIEVEVLDHFIVGDGKALSFAQRGYL
ncbi:MAG: DNA repair protein RadC [Rudaea sp.]